MSNNIGKLKQTLKEKCDDCNCHLQLREKIEDGRKIIYKYCHVCDESFGKVESIPLKNPFRNGEFA